MKVQIDTIPVLEAYETTDECPFCYLQRITEQKAIRYTAMVSTGRLRNGTATFCLSVLQGNRVMSNVAEFTVNTRR